MSERYFSTAVLRHNIETLLRAAGATDEIREDIAWSLIETSLAGIDSHGLAMLPKILGRCASGRSQIQKSAVEISNQPDRAFAMLDAGLAPGQHACLKAVRLGLQKADQFGLGYVTVKNSTHLGGVYPYLWLAVQQGYCALVGSNSAQSMAALGSKTVNLGNNPFGFGAPTKSGIPFLFDFSSAVMSYGRLNQLKKQGLEIPSDAFIPNTETAEGGRVYEIAGHLTHIALPFGDYKGASVAMMIEILSAMLGQGVFGRETEVTPANGEFQGPSHFVLVFKPGHFLGSEDAFLSRMQSYCDGLHLDGQTVRIPGEKSFAERKIRSSAGIPVTDLLRDEWDADAQKWGCTLSW